MNYKELAIKKFEETCELIEFESEEEWLKMRQLGIGGSDVASIMGHSPWKSVVDIYKSKKEEQKQLDSEAINFGKNIEDPQFKLFAYKYKDTYVSLDFKNIMFRNLFVPFYQASLDGVLIEKATNKVGIYEGKTKQDGVSGWYDDDGDRTIPKYYLDQGIHYFNTTDVDFVVFNVLINYRDDFNDVSMKILSPRRIDREDVLEYMAEVNKKCMNFWNNYVSKDIEPNNILSY